MECRFVQLTFSGSMALDGFELTAWKTHYPWYDGDSHFSSSNATLDAVWELCRYTLEAASLDTYTDSNTRERRPCVPTPPLSASRTVPSELRCSCEAVQESYHRGQTKASTTVAATEVF